MHAGRYVDNALQDMDVLEMGFELVDAASGRLTRTFEWSGTVTGGLHSAADFPFNVEAVGIRFWTSSCWRTHDGNNQGQAARGAPHDAGGRLCGRRVVHALWRDAHPDAGRHSQRGQPMSPHDAGSAPGPLSP